MSSSENTNKNPDLHDARCVECGARCLPGQPHVAHNAGWRKKVMIEDWNEIVMDGYPGWDLVDPGDGTRRRPSFVRLAIRNKVDESSADITRAFDDVATGQFYSRDWGADSSPSVGGGELYYAGWWFQRREDAQAFVRRHGGTAG